MGGLAPDLFHHVFGTKPRFQETQAGAGRKILQRPRTRRGTGLRQRRGATLFALLHGFFPEAIWPWLGFAAALAAVNADTWATELGVLNPHPPRMINNLRKVVEKGTSGGISLVGTLASLAGSALIALLAVLLSPTPITNYYLLLTLAGLAGSLFDSLLGATVQAIYFCPKDQKETERHPLHTCGAETVQIRGWKWLTNDWVNFGCGAMGAVVALWLGML